MNKLTRTKARKGGRGMQMSRNIFNTIVAGISLVATFALITVGLTQLASCTSVIPLDSYDKHLVHFHEEGIELPHCEWCNGYTTGEH
tara:strand:- start:124 stop:384 length:261 start_codon:yes stop_codon:yes gene_type:complete